MRHSLHGLMLAGLLVGAPNSAVTNRALAAAPAPAPAGFYETSVAQYMDGQWEPLRIQLAAKAGDIAALPPAQKADIDYIRKASAECRPIWWKPCKAGQKTRLKPLVFGQTLPAVFDPNNKVDISMAYADGVPSAVLMWDFKEMDDPTVQGEIEFTKGEQSDVNLWTTIGTAVSWSEVSGKFQMGMSNDERAAFNRYLSFRGNLSGAYYCTPRARRYAVWAGIGGWSHEYDKVNTVMARKTIGILFVEEVLSHPEIYRSVPRPKDPGADRAESKIVWELQDWIRHHDLTFAEDKAFREAIKSLAAANEAKARQSGKVMLANGQSFALDAAADKPLEVQRDTWIAGRYSGKK